MRSDGAFDVPRQSPLYESDCMKRKSTPSGDDKDELQRMVNTLLAQQGIPERQQTPLIAQVFGFTPQHARRKLSGETPWQMPEVAVLAAHFSTSTRQMMEPLVFEGTEPALLVISEVRIPCEVRVIPAITAPPFKQQFVALGEPGNWVVVPASGFSLPAREVELLVVRSRPAPPPDAPGIPDAEGSA
jgi:hypothetical protein